MGGVPEEKCIMIIAGEASGDLHGSKLVTALQKRDRSFSFCGIGGQALKKAGTNILVEASELSVVGIIEVFSKIPAILKGMSVAKKFLKSRKPDLLVLIDFPDFNLHLAKFAKKANIPILYYISPQVWAWRQSRIKKIKKLVDHMAVILPFEEDFYKKHEVPATFVGHPLLDATPRTYNTKKVEILKTIGILPGSRSGEISKHLPVMVEAAHKMKNLNKKLGFIISLAPDADKGFMEEIVKKIPGPASFEFVSGGAYKIFERSVLVVAVSGTVTLEAAIFGIPMLIIYKMSPISFFLGKLLVNLEHVGLANLIAKEDIVPELLQEEVNPENISNMVCSMLEDVSSLEIMRKKLMGVKDLLGGPGVSERTADIAIDIINRPRPF